MTILVHPDGPQPIKMSSVTCMGGGGGRDAHDWLWRTVVSTLGQETVVGGLTCVGIGLTTARLLDK